MELIKRIFVCILILAGVAVAGLLCCFGVMAAFPDIRIFGYKFLSTGNKSVEETIINLDDINILDSTASDYLATVNIDANDYNVEILATAKNEIKILATNRVSGFTNSPDSNLEPRVTYVYDDATKTVNISTNCPKGWFIKKDICMTVYLPTKIEIKDKVPHPGSTEDKPLPDIEAKVTTQFDVVTRSNKGATTLGKQDTPVNIKNLTSSCTNARGKVILTNYNITGNVKINNIFGRIIANKDIAGNVTVDSTIGTYEFQNIGGDLNIIASTTEGKINNPYVRAKNIKNLNYTAESGSLVITGLVDGEVDIDTNSANINIERTFGEVAINGKDANITINQVGCIDNTKKSDPTVKHTITLESGNIQINKSLQALSLTTKKGKITAKQCYREVCANSTTGAIDVEFNDGTVLVADEKINEETVNYFNENYANYLNNYSGTLPSLEINSEHGTIKAVNIRNTAEVMSTDSQVTLHFLKVVKGNKVKTDRQLIDILIESNDAIKTIARALKNTNSKLSVKFGNVILPNWPTLEDVNENLMFTPEKNIDGVVYKEVKMFFNSAKDNCENVLDITTKNGQIKISKVEK